MEKRDLQRDKNRENLPEGTMADIEEVKQEIETAFGNSLLAEEELLQEYQEELTEIDEISKIHFYPFD